MQDAYRPLSAARRPQRRHRDAPDTSAAQRRLAELPPGAERTAVRSVIVTAWLPVAHRIARGYRHRGEDLADLEQVAALGLTKAVDRYDPHRGHAFESYAIPVITGEIKKHFRDCTWDVHVPRRVQELRSRVRSTVRRLESEHGGRRLTVATLAEHSGLSEEDVLLGLDAAQSYSCLSLDAEWPGEQSGSSILDSYGANEPGYEQVLQRTALRPSLRELPERERRALYLRYFCEMTQSRIAEELATSQMQVSRVLRRACETLRREVAEDAG